MLAIFAHRLTEILGFLRRYLYPCPQDVKETPCKGLVRPVLEYVSSVLDLQDVVFISY